MASPLAVPLAPDLWRLRLAGDFTNAYAVRDEDGQVTLIDTGLKFSANKVSKALRSVGIEHSDVARILISHVHSDHAGSAATMADRTDASVSVHSDDAVFLRTGTTPPLDQSLRLGRFFSRFAGKGQAFTPVEPADELVDGRLLPYGGGLRVLHTPGHSPGHVSFLHEPSGVLVTGDALFNVLGRLGWSVPFFCTDFRMSQRTAQRFTELDFSTVAFMHGPHVADDAQRYVGQFLARKKIKD